jgi:hypothetical protein
MSPWVRPFEESTITPRVVSVPDLFHSSPACILSFLVVATVRGEFKEAWKWIDGADDVKTEGEDGTLLKEERSISKS